MIGYTVQEVTGVCVGAEYVRLGLDQQGVGLYYSRRYRHTLLTRHGVVFRVIVNVQPEDVYKEWNRHVWLIAHPEQELPTQRYEWQTILMTDAVTTEPNAYGMYTALQAVYVAAHDQYGRLRKMIRPAALKMAVNDACAVFAEVQEDIREAMRVARPQTEAEASEDARRTAEGVQCRMPFFLRGECVSCGKGPSEHGTEKPSREDREYGRVEGDDDPDSLTYGGR